MSIMSVVSIFFEPIPSVISIQSEPVQEPVLTQLSREAIKAIIAENESLCAACAAEREALTLAFTSPISIPLEHPSTGFLAKRARAEERCGSSMQKFFTP